MDLETYISIDVESDGPIPGDYSLLSLGAVAFDPYGRELGWFKANLRPLPGAGQHPDTMEWWQGQPVAWEAATQGAQDPSEVMATFDRWVRTWPGKPVAVCYPAGYDWTFTYWYLIHFLARSPFGFQALDIKSFAMAVLGTPFRGTHKKTMPPAWFRGLPPHTHDAVDDAREQGCLFFAARNRVR